jgi:hypothetical protein
MVRGHSFHDVGLRHGDGDPSPHRFKALDASISPPRGGRMRRFLTERGAVSGAFIGRLTVEVLQ